MEITNINYSIKTKLKLEKMINRNLFIINPQAYDSIDALSGVISFLISDVAEFYGLVKPNQTSKDNSERRSILNKQKLEYYQNKLQELNKKLELF